VDFLLLPIIEGSPKYFPVPKTTFAPKMLATFLPQKKKTLIFLGLVPG